MAQNRVFFPQVALDEWIADDTVVLEQGELVIVGEGRRYSVNEAVRIVTEVTGAEDPHELVGRVKSVSYLNELGAELLDTSMIVGDFAYDVVPGFLGQPVGSFREHLAGSERADALVRSDALSVQQKPANDESLLARYLLNTLE